MRFLFPLVLLAALFAALFDLADAPSDGPIVTRADQVGQKVAESR